MFREISGVVFEGCSGVSFQVFKAGCLLLWIAVQGFRVEISGSKDLKNCSVKIFELIRLCLKLIVVDEQPELLLAD